jgi:hypothetical protein
MLYAVFGVPLMILCLSNLGQLLAHTFEFAYSHMCCNRQRSSQKRHNKSSKKYEVSSLPQSPDLMIPPPEQFKRKPPPPPPPPRLTPPSKPRRPLSPDVRQLLFECAEYSVKQGAEPSAQRLLHDLQQQRNKPLSAHSYTHHSGAEDEDDDDEPSATPSYRYIILYL